MNSKNIDLYNSKQIDLFYNKYFEINTSFIFIIIFVILFFQNKKRLNCDK